VKKPGKMRWDYKSPEQKLFLSDGRRIYLHVPADNQVIIPFDVLDFSQTQHSLLPGRLTDLCLSRQLFCPNLGSLLQRSHLSAALPWPLSVSHKSKACSGTNPDRAPVVHRPATCLLLSGALNSRLPPCVYVEEWPRRSRPFIHARPCGVFTGTHQN